MHGPNRNPRTKPSRDRKGTLRAFLVALPAGRGSERNIDIMVSSEVFTKMRIPRWCLRFALLALFYSPIYSNLAAQSEAEVNASIKKFTQIYEAVETNFADKVDPD